MNKSHVDMNLCLALLSRRTAASVVLLAAPAVWLGRRATAQPLVRRATPAQTEGPFYPTRLPADSDFDLLRNGTLDHTGGQPVWVTGTVTDIWAATRCAARRSRSGNTTKPATIPATATEQRALFRGSAGAPSMPTAVSAFARCGLPHTRAARRTSM